MKRILTTILLLLVVSISSLVFSQQRNVVINTNSVDRTVITTDPNVDIWTQLEQERIAAERAKQERMAAKKAEQERIAAEKAEQERITAEKAEQERIATESAKPIVQSNNETAKTQSTPQMASAEDIIKLERVHQQILKLTEHYYGGQVYKKYNNIYKSLPQTEVNVQNIRKIQFIVISYLNSKGEAYPELDKQLKNTSSMEEDIQIFLSYYKQ